MARSLTFALVALALFAHLSPAQDVRRAKVKKIDIDAKTITLTVEGKDQDFALTDETRFPGSTGKDLKERLQWFKVGDDVEFLPGMRDGKAVLRGLRKPGGGGQELPKIDTSKLVPLTELGAKEYQGFKGGLYPDGKNERPEGHEAAGLRLAKELRPLDKDGKPADDGKIVLLSVGMSNTSQSSQGFQRSLRDFDDKNPKLVFVNGAQGGMTAARIQDPDTDSGKTYWTRVDQMLENAKVTPAQVQVVWIKQADAGPTQGFPKYAQTLQAELTKIVQLLPKRFPNVKLAYLSSRTYGGFAKTRLNPEPYAYESAFSVKWLIEQQIKGEAGLNFDPKKGDVKAPWLSWGPYLWANGTTKRADGFFYEEADFTPNDGTHQSPSGQAKVGKLLLDYFKSDNTTKPWFLGKK